MSDPHSRLFRTRGQPTVPSRPADPLPPPDPEELLGEWLDGDRPIQPEPGEPIEEPTEGLQALVVSLPGELWERARLQAEAGGFGTLEAYAAALLCAAIQSHGEAVRIEPDPEILEPEAEPIEGEDDEPPPTAITRVDWGGIAAGIDPDPELADPGGEGEDANPEEGEEIAMDRANLAPARPAPEELMAMVLRHAAPGVYDPSSFLAALRRGEPPEPAAARELLDALGALERFHEGESLIDRRLAFALHRLAFEGQVLLTDAWERPVDAPTVALLRAVQEAVDRILSGEDIRYDRP
jgi:hypothetical protein